MNIYHFYHIWADGNWKSIVTEHIKYLTESKLGYVLSSFEIGIVGQQKNIDKVKNYIKNISPIGFNICHETPAGYEQETLERIRQYDKEDGYVLYAHTKGSFRDDNKSNTKWRNDMSKRLISDWINCIDLLRTHSLIGCRYFVVKDEYKNIDIYDITLDNVACYSNSITMSKRGIFYGNFWWSHLKYLKKLPVPRPFSRTDAERWTTGLVDIVDNYSVFDKDPYFDLEYFTTGKSKGGNVLND